MDKFTAKFSLRGTIVATLTPMKPNGDINFEAFLPYAEFLSKIGVSGIFVNGTLGEGISLTVEERKQTAEKWREVSEGRLDQVIVHVGAANLRDTITLSKHASTLGVDAFASMCSIFYKPRTEDELLGYIKEVAGAAPALPFYYYDIDFMTGVHLDVMKFLEMSKDKIPNLRGLKYSSQKPYVAYMSSQLHDRSFQIAIGTNDQCLQHLVVGLDVTIADTSYASLQIKLKKAYEDQDYEAANNFQLKTCLLTSVINKYGPMVPVCKEIVGMLTGIDMGPCRPPVVNLSQARDSLRKDLEKLDYFKWV